MKNPMVTSSGSNKRQEHVCEMLLSLIRNTQQNKNKQILRLPKTSDKIGRCPASIWSDVKSGCFPPPIRIGQRSVGWVESEIDAWIAARELATRSGVVINLKTFVSLMVTRDPIAEEGKGLIAFIERPVKKTRVAVNSNFLSCNQNGAQS